MQLLVACILTMVSKRKLVWINQLKRTVFFLTRDFCNSGFLLRRQACNNVRWKVPNCSKAERRFYADYFCHGCGVAGAESELGRGAGSQCGDEGQRLDSDGEERNVEIKGLSLV